MPSTGSGGVTKRAAPISASAFSFSINKKPRQTPVAAASLPPAPPPLKLAAAQTPPRIKRELCTTPAPAAAPARAADAGTPLRSILDIRTPHRPFSPSNDVEEYDAKPSVPSLAQDTPRRISILKPLNAFATPDPKRHDELPTSATARRLNSFAHQLTPRIEIESDDRPKRPLQAIALPERVADDLISRRKTALVEEDEGIGVSPRGKRIAKWAGKGAQPPSVRLANLLSSANASLQLFHTAMQHTLYPTQRARLTPARPVQKATSTVATPITAFQHIQSAPLRVRLDGPVMGPTHHSVLFWCEILASQPPSIPISARVLIAFPPIPPESPRLGLDPRLIAIKATDELSKRWQVGIWAWSEVPLPRLASNEEADSDTDSKAIMTLLATRYLVVEEPDPL